MRENNDSCTFLIHRSAFEFLSTISKYTPARPDVKHAAVTAAKPFKGFMIWPFGAAAAALPTTSTSWWMEALFPAVVLNLHNTHSEREEEEGHPFCIREDVSREARQRKRLLSEFSFDMRPGSWLRAGCLSRRTVGSFE